VKSTLAPVQDTVGEPLVVLQPPVAPEPLYVWVVEVYDVGLLALTEEPWADFRTTKLATVPVT
jgi:hypothetical protein